MLPTVLRRAADAALEVAVVPSFSRFGPAARRRLHGWEQVAPDALRDRAVVVTGATSGLGAAIAGRAADLGAQVVAVGRDPDRGRRIAARCGPGARFVRTDVAEPDDVRALAEELADRHERIHALVHNAGALLGERRTNRVGIEVTWASMVVGPHLLTRLLAERTDRAIWMSSGGMYLQALDLDDWGWEQRPWDGTRAYAQAKRAQVDLVAEATGRGEVPLQVAMHPGWASTPGVDASLPGFARVMGPLLRTPEEGADTAIWLATRAERDLQAGGFYLDRQVRSTVRWPGTGTSPGDRARLRALVDRQAGLVPARSAAR